jgi:hypothetical protein
MSQELLLLPPLLFPLPPGTGSSSDLPQEAAMRKMAQHKSMDLEMNFFMTLYFEIEKLEIGNCVRLNLLA